MQLAIQSDHKEGGRRILLFQNVEDFWRIVWIRTIVKCQSDLARRVAVAINDPRRRKVGYGLGDDHPFCRVELYLPCAVPGSCGDPQNLALSFIIQTITVFHLCQFRCGGFIKWNISSEETPERRVFA